MVVLDTLALASKSWFVIFCPGAILNLIKEVHSLDPTQWSTANSRFH